jgi:hypothetical protein
MAVKGEGHIAMLPPTARRIQKSRAQFLRRKAEPRNLFSPKEGEGKS